MADLKTTLRELSVVVGVYVEIEKQDFAYAPNIFTRLCRMALPNIGYEKFSSIESLICFNDEHIRIINNGFSLSRAIINMLKIDRIYELNWYGFDTQKGEPYDISINGYKFSLKENSFILENMGLYKLLNLLTGSEYSTRHLFKDYALLEYENWFSVTWNEMKKILKSNNNYWERINPTKGEFSSIKISNDSIYLEYEVGAFDYFRELPLNCNLKEFEKNTNNKIREKVFAKFINEMLSKNEKYNNAKKECAKKAAERVVDELNNNLDYEEGLPRFLGIHDSEYFYAKTTDHYIDLFLVPSKKDYQMSIEIQSIEASVPSTQANILTTIRNKITGNRLVLKNECRFTHGQFNGTPEAKLYYESGSLSSIYNPPKI